MSSHVHQKHTLSKAEKLMKMSSSAAQLQDGRKTPSSKSSSEVSAAPVFRNTTSKIKEQPVKMREKSKSTILMTQRDYEKARKKRASREVPVRKGHGVSRDSRTCLTLMGLEKNTVLNLQTSRKRSRIQLHSIF